MKYSSALFSALFFVLMVRCTLNQRSENPENWSEDQVSEWFDQKDWLGPTELQPDPSIDAKEFSVRYHQNKDLWDQAFTFLKEKDLSVIKTGIHELDGKNVFVIVSEYDSKNPGDAQYESHKDYTDIQYVVSGTEYIGLADLSSTSIKIPYDEEKDIAFYNVDEGQNLLANPGHFFIFFPTNAHSPGMKVEENVPVKKVVIKVKN